MPAVPNVLGVPPLSSYSAATSIVLLAADAISLLSGLFGPQWGIFLGGAPVVISDNVVSLDYKQEWTVSDYPVEQGAFESYDRVQLPFEARVRFSTGGSIVDRLALLTSLQAITLGTQLFDVVTPEAVYPSVSIHHYDYRRTADAAGLLQVDVWCTQVRVTTTTQFSNTASPSGANPTGTGSVQTTPATNNLAGQIPNVT